MAASVRHGWVRPPAQIMAWSRLLLYLMSMCLWRGTRGSPPPVTYDALFEAGMAAYSDERWYECVTLMQKALEDYHWYRTELVRCRRQCQHPVHRPLQHLAAFYETVVRSSDCLRRCKMKALSDRPQQVVNKHVEEAFSKRLPYDFLQFSYYKTDDIKSAVSAAYTYLMRNPGHKVTLQNLAYYQGLPEIKNDYFVDLEKRPYQEFYIKASDALNENNWLEMVESMEKCIAKYLEDEEDCRLLCEGAYDHKSFPDFINVVADHYISVLKCQHKCEDSLAQVYSEKIDDFVPDMYNYLQYGYYNLKDLDNAVTSTASYLLFRPNDSTMLQNKYHYMKSGYREESFIPRHEALKYYKRRMQEANILKFVAEEYISPHDDDEDQQDDFHLLLLNLDSSDVFRMKQLPEGHYLKKFEPTWISVIAEQEDLRRQNRLIVDKFVKLEQCEELVDFANLKKSNSNGIREITLKDGLKLMDESTDNEISLRTFLQVSSIVKLFLEKALNITHLFFKDAKLICRDEWADDDDDCFMQEDGSCESGISSNGGNDYYAILYIKSLDSSGGGYFKEPEEIVVRPKCGRLVVFDSSDHFGVKPFSSEQRCLIMSVLGPQPTFTEIHLRDTIALLRQNDQKRFAADATERKEMMSTLKRQGMKITMTGRDLRGKERFAADGIASSEECSTLIELADVGSVRGDGYKQEAGRMFTISPHTKYEMFQGLTVERAAKLAEIEVVRPEAVKLYLKLSERSRIIVEQYLNLTQPLYFDFTHLVCRTAVDSKLTDREDLSHPIHADNCLLQLDGSCKKEVPAYIQRDYSGLMYLNDNFEGGEFIFAHPNKSEQTLLKPRCGRLVGFNAADLHGVKAVLKGKRCALAMWYTLNPDFNELAHVRARRVLLKREKNKLGKNPLVGPGGEENPQEMHISRDEL